VLLFLCLVKSIFALLLFLFFLGQTLFFPMNPNGAVAVATEAGERAAPAAR